MKTAEHLAAQSQIIQLGGGGKQRQSGLKADGMSVLLFLLFTCYYGSFQW